MKIKFVCNNVKIYGQFGRYPKVSDLNVPDQVPIFQGNSENVVGTANLIKTETEILAHTKTLFNPELMTPCVHMIWDHEKKTGSITGMQYSAVANKDVNILPVGKQQL